MVPVFILLTAFVAGFAAGLLWTQRRKRVVRHRCPACQRFIGRRAIHICPQS